MQICKNAGSILFPLSLSSVASSFQSIATSWSPPVDALYPTDRCLEISLPNFDRNNLSGKAYNTIAIKFTAPAESKRFRFVIYRSELHGNYFFSFDLVNL
jgi:hypothetical protein